MNKAIALLLGMTLLGMPQIQAKTMIPQNTTTTSSDLMTPEDLWAMGRMGGAAASPDGKLVVYQITKYSVKDNKGCTKLYIQSTSASKNKVPASQCLTPDNTSESDAAWIDGGKKIAFLREGQVWAMNADGTGRVKLTDSTAQRSY